MAIDKMKELNFPHFEFKYKVCEGKTWIYDALRKKYVVLLPEEWVRQNLIAFLMIHKNYPRSLITVEKQIIYNNLKKRADIVVFAKNGKPAVIVECKAYNVDITNETLLQLSQYAASLHTRMFLLSNGIKHFFGEYDLNKKKYIFLDEIPEYKYINDATLI